METSPYELWMDTGGTFTDCLARLPDGKVRSFKILSNGALRGRINRWEDGKTLYFEAQWPTQASIFEGYAFRILPDSPPVLVEKVDSSARRIVLQTPSPTLGLGTFELTAFEEPPILAARLVTETALGMAFPPITLKLGSTRGTNALLERKGARVALLITQGFRDLPLIGTQARPELFALEIRKPPPLYAGVFEVPERLAADGGIIKDLSEEAVQVLVQSVQQGSFDSVAIALLHSYRNPIHEQYLENAFRDAGFRFVSASSALAPHIKLLFRTETTLINAYLDPLIRTYLSGILGKLSWDTTPNFRVMTSAGHLVRSDLFTAKDSLLSGPAGGVIGSARIARLCGENRLLTFDMGGTSTDVSRYDNGFDYRMETQIGDVRLLSPSLAIETVAAGGGSVCGFDGFRLTVGPKSAGAYPGPACYGAGGPLTITDINLLAGRLDSPSFGLPIVTEAAKSRIEEIQQRLHENTGKNFSKEALLAGFIQIANEKMADAIRKISLAKGANPAMYSLLGFGGAGGQHVCALADALGIQKILIPYQAGLLSAYGIGHAAIERFAHQEILTKLPSMPRLRQYFRQLETQIRVQLSEEGIPEATQEIVSQTLRLRLSGQESWIEVPMQENRRELARVFKTAYERMYGHWIAGSVIECVSIQARGRNRLPPEVFAETTSHYVPPATRSTFFLVQKTWFAAPVYQWEELNSGATLNGPALLVSQNATVVLEPGWQLSLNTRNVAVIDRC
ncbi:MAG TPA: hydantoinase/oxoprolinase family protein [Rhodothermales bacterium]|nr:hydantoinase/oxoprolinase family protein [Rhodothermales bacterium]